MSFSFALPAAASAATTANSGASAGAAGQAGAVGDPLGLFGQLLTMLGIDPGAAGEIDPKTIAQTLGKAAAKVEGAAGQDDDKPKDAAKTDTAAPVDLSALIAALLAAAQQNVPAPTSPVAVVDSSSAEPGVGGIAGDGKSALPIQAQLETLMAALTGQAQPETPGAKPSATPGTATIAKPELALAAPRSDVLAQPQPPAPALPEAPAAIENPAAPPVAETAAALAAQPDAAIQLQLAAVDPKAMTPARPTAAKPAASLSTAKGQDQAKDAPALDAASATVAQPASEIPKGQPAGKPGAELAALAGDLAVKPAEKPADDEAQPDMAAGPAAQALANDAAAPLAAQTAVRGSPETVAKLAAQIIKKLDAKTTRFDVALDPIGLGRVDVKVEIGANGKLHAQMSFDNAGAASDLRGRAGQLREALEQAGFDLRGGSLTFDAAGQGGQGRGQQQQQQSDHPRFAGAAGVFEAALNLGDIPIAAPVWAKNGAASGVDIRI